MHIQTINTEHEYIWCNCGKGRLVNCFTCIIQVIIFPSQHTLFLYSLILKSSITFLNDKSAIKLHTLYYLTHLFGFVLAKTLEGAAIFDRASSWPAKRHSKTVQTEFKFYKDLAWPKTKRQNLTNLVSDHGDQRYRRFVKGIQHVNHFTFGSNGLIPVGVGSRLGTFSWIRFFSCNQLRIS